MVLRQNFAEFRFDVWTRQDLHRGSLKQLAVLDADRPIRVTQRRFRIYATKPPWPDGPRVELLNLWDGTSLLA